MNFWNQNSARLNPQANGQSFPSAQTNITMYQPMAMPSTSYHSSGMYSHSVPRPNTQQNANNNRRKRRGINKGKDHQLDDKCE